MEKKITNKPKYIREDRLLSIKSYLHKWDKLHLRKFTQFTQMQYLYNYLKSFQA